MISRRELLGQGEELVASWRDRRCRPRISQSTPAGFRPAMRARSTVRFGVPGAAQHAAFLGHQRKEMARAGRNRTACSSGR